MNTSAIIHDSQRCMSSYYHALSTMGWLLLLSREVRMISHYILWWLILLLHLLLHLLLRRHTNIYEIYTTMCNQYGIRLLILLSHSMNDEYHSLQHSGNRHSLRWVASFPAFIYYSNINYRVNVSISIVSHYSHTQKELLIWLVILIYLILLCGFGRLCSREMMIVATPDWSASQTRAINCDEVPWSS